VILAIVGCLIATLAIITALLAIACVQPEPTKPKPCENKYKDKP